MTTVSAHSAPLPASLSATPAGTGALSRQAPSLTAPSLTGRAPSDREKLAQAAKQFEAIFVRQMLASARAAKLGGEDDLLGGQALDTFRQMQDERFADIAAGTGALGFAKSLETQLAAVAGMTATTPGGSK